MTTYREKQTDLENRYSERAVKKIIWMETKHQKKWRVLSDTYTPLQRTRPIK
jgi:hypothetical protein